MADLMLQYYILKELMDAWSFILSMIIFHWNRKLPSGCADVKLEQQVTFRVTVALDKCTVNIMRQLQSQQSFEYALNHHLCIQLKNLNCAVYDTILSFYFKPHPQNSCSCSRVHYSPDTNLQVQL